MNPRLKTSKTWSSLPTELLEQISSIFKENFSKKLGNTDIKAEGRIYKEELLLGIGFNKENEIRQVNFEASIAYDKKKENVLNLIHLAVDCIGSMFENYIKDPETEFPLIWSPFKMEDKEVFLIKTGSNTDLEKKADELLNIKDESLVKGDDNPGINPETIKSNLGIKD